MKIIVTGASGFIGSNLVPALAKKGHEVAAVCRGECLVEGVEWIFADLAERNWNPASRLPLAADAVVHLAQSGSYRDFPEAAADVFEVNTASTFKMLNYAREAGASHFIYASSGTIYAGLEEPVLTETLTIAPADFSGHKLGFYSATKFCSEALVESFREQFESISSLRIFAPYGPGGDSSLVNRLVARVAAGEKIQIQGNPGLTFNPVHVNDIERIISTLLRSGRSAGVMNVAGNEIVSLTDLVKLTADLCGRCVEIDYSESDPPEGRKLIADTEKMEALTGGTQISLAQGIRSCSGVPVENLPDESKDQD